MEHKRSRESFESIPNPQEGNVSKVVCKREETLPFDLPDEVIALIMGYLDSLFVIGKCTLISKQFIQVIKQLGDFSLTLNKPMNNVLSFTRSKYLEGVKHLAITYGCYSSDYLDPFKLMVNLTHFDFQERVRDMFLEPVDNRILKQFLHPNMKSLTIRNATLNRGFNLVLFGLDNLEELNLYDSHLGLHTLDSSNLTDLKISASSIKYFETWDLKNLTSLKINNETVELQDNTFLENSLKTISQLHNLQCLCFSGIRLDEESLKQLSALKKLIELGVKNCFIDSIGAVIISEMTGLKRLNICGNPIGDTGMQHIAKLKKLECLDVAGTKITCKGANIVFEMKQLTNLNIGENSLGNTGLKNMTNLNRLTEVNIGHNNIGERCLLMLIRLNSMRTLFRITTLHIENPKGILYLGDDEAKLISELVHVRHLNVGYNEIGDEGAKAISTMTQLITLGINNNLINDEGKELAKLIYLTDLNVAHNKTDLNFLKTSLKCLKEFKA